MAACDGLEIDGLRFELAHLQRGEAILRVFPGADDRVTDSDAFFKDWHPVLRPQAQVPEAEAHGACRRDVDARRRSSCSRDIPSTSAAPPTGSRR